jgi:hypothetical protein
MKSPGWFEMQITSATLEAVNVNIKLKYIPVYMIVDMVIKTVGWKLWFYPKAIRYLLQCGIAPESL